MDWLDTVVILAAHIPALTMVVQAVKKIFEQSWLIWLLKLLKIGWLQPYIPIILNVCIGILSGLALYGEGGITIREIILIVMAIFGADGLHDIVRRPKEG